MCKSSFTSLTWQSSKDRSSVRRKVIRILLILLARWTARLDWFVDAAENTIMAGYSADTPNLINLNCPQALFFPCMFRTPECTIKDKTDKKQLNISYKPLFPVSIKNKTRGGVYVECYCLCTRWRFTVANVTDPWSRLHESNKGDKNRSFPCDFKRFHEYYPYMYELTFKKSSGNWKWRQEV